MARQARTALTLHNKSTSGRSQHRVKARQQCCSNIRTGAARTCPTGSRCRSARTSCARRPRSSPRPCSARPPACSAPPGSSPGAAGRQPAGPPQASPRAARASADTQSARRRTRPGLHSIAATACPPGHPAHDVALAAHGDTPALDRGRTRCACSATYAVSKMLPSMLDTATSATIFVFALSICVRACARRALGAPCQAVPRRRGRAPGDTPPRRLWLARPQAARLHVQLLRVGRQRDVAQPRARALAGQLPGHQVAVVLRHRHQHLRARRASAGCPRRQPPQHL